MEEDIKYLKDQIKRIKLEYMPCELFVFDRLIQAIENILNRLEQDERVIEKMATYIENDSRFKLSPVARGVKEDLLNILKENQKEV